MDRQAIDVHDGIAFSNANCAAQDGSTAPMAEVRFWQTLLRKSVTADGCPSAIRLLTTGFDLPALTLVTQLQRYAIHGAIVGGGRAPSDANRRRF